MKNLKTKKIHKIIALSVLTLGTLTLENALSTEVYAIESPRNVRAISIRDEYIRVNWDAVKDSYMEAKGELVQYEVYVIEGDKREYVGTTTDTGFVFVNLKKNTSYKFQVIALDHIGSSIPDTNYISNSVMTKNSAGTLDKDGALTQRTKTERVGNSANIIIGTDSINNYNKNLYYTVDLTRDEFVGVKDVVVSIPSKVILNKSQKLIKIINTDYTLSFIPNVFTNEVIRENKDKNSAGVRFRISPTSQNLTLKNLRDKSFDIISKKYLLEANTFVGSTSTQLSSLNGNIHITLDYDSYRAKSRRLKALNLAKYDAFEQAYKIISASEGGASTGTIDELGTYLTIGSRR